MINAWPCYWGTGGEVTFISRDWREAAVKLKLTLRTRNYVGTIFGGSLYGAIDPIYMIMLIKLLGKDYEVWDKAAAIRFRKPGRSTLRATFRLDDGELDQIKRDVAASGRTERTYTVELKDGEGNVCMSCDKLLTIRARPPR